MLSCGSCKPFCSDLATASLYKALDLLKLILILSKIAEEVVSPRSVFKLIRHKKGPSERRALEIKRVSYAFLRRTKASPATATPNKANVFGSGTADTATEPSKIISRIDTLRFTFPVEPEKRIY